MRMLFFLLPLLLLSCNRMDEYRGTHITKSHWIHNANYGDTTIAIPFNFQLNTAFRLVGTKENHFVTIDGEKEHTTKTEQDSLEVLYRVLADTIIESGDSTMGLASIVYDDISFTGWRNIIFGLRSDDINSFWTTIFNNNPPTLKMVHQSYLQAGDQKPDLFETDTLVINYKARFGPSLVMALNKTIYNKSLFSQYLLAMESDTAMKKDFQEEIMQPKVTELIRRAIFIDKKGRLSPNLTKQQEQHLYWFNLHFLFYGIINSVYDRNLTNAPHAIQYHKVEMISTTFLENEKTVVDTISHIIGHSYREIRWLETKLSTTQTMRHGAKASITAKRHKDLSSQTTEPLFFMPLPMLSAEGVKANAPLEGVATSPHDTTYQISSAPFHIKSYYSFYAPYGKNREDRMISGDMMVHWHFSKNKKTATVFAQDVYFGQLITFVRETNLYYTNSGESKKLTEKVNLTFKEMVQ